MNKKREGQRDIYTETEGIEVHILTSGCLYLDGKIMAFFCLSSSSSSLRNNTHCVVKKINSNKFMSVFQC